MQSCCAVLPVKPFTLLRFSFRDRHRILRSGPLYKVPSDAGADLGGGCRGCAPLPPPAEMTCGFLIQLVFCKKKLWFIGVEVEQETSAPPPKKNPGSAPAMCPYVSISPADNVLKLLFIPGNVLSVS